MKTRFLLPLACAASLAVAVPTHAGNDAGRNMIIGGIAGAIIGDHNDHHAAEGAFLGATAGLLLSAITNDNRCDSRHEVYYDSTPSYPTNVIVSRPYCPAPSRVVVVHPAPAGHHSREVVVVHPAPRPAPRAFVSSSRDGHDHRNDRRDDHRNDRRDRYACNR
jgi:hypothetical protein